jgi:glutathione S-transferase
VLRQSDQKEADIATRILLLHYLLTADGTPLSDRWIAFRNLPGGLGYDGAFQRRANLRLANAFGANRKAFEKAARALSGEQLTFGDASFLFRVLPRVWLAVVLHLEDEEFPASANVLFDAAASHYLPTEDLAVLGGILAGRLIKAARTKEPHASD